MADIMRRRRRKPRPPSIARSWRRGCRLELRTGRLSQYMIRADISTGALMPVLEEFSPGDYQTLYALYFGHDNPAQRVRCFVDFLLESFAEPRGPSPGAYRVAHWRQLRYYCHSHKTLDCDICKGRIV